MHYFLSEEERDPYRIPTKHNIRMAMYWLVQGCQAGDSLVFHYSGHGSQQRNYTGDEVDGFDETLCPLDFETQGMIVDDEINATLVRPLPRGAKLHAIIDACHSGTMLDLPYFCRMDRYVTLLLLVLLNSQILFNIRSCLMFTLMIKAIKRLAKKRTYAELDDMCGKTIVLDQEHGKEQMEERLYLSVVVMIIKNQQIQMYISVFYLKFSIFLKWK